MLLVVAINHTLKQGAGFVTQGTRIEVDHQEDGKYKTNNNMQNIIKQKSADIKDGIGDSLRKHKSYSWNNQ